MCLSAERVSLSLRSVVAAACVVEMVKRSHVLSEGVLSLFAPWSSVLLLLGGGDGDEESHRIPLRFFLHLFSLAFSAFVSFAVLRHSRASW